LPPTIRAVATYVNNERVRYLSILTYFSYGNKISAASINAAKEIVMTIMGISGNTSLTAAAIAPMSAPMFIVFATRRRDTRGNRTLLEYFLLIIPAIPSPVANPIRAHIS
jgi:alpha/beta superfamily hydrolase